MRFLRILPIVVLVQLSGCSLNTNDVQKDYFFLRKKYNISRIYYINEDGSISESSIPAGSYCFDIGNTYLDFYYGGLDYFRENGSKFIVSIAFKGPSDEYDIDYLNEMNGVVPTIGDYSFNSKRDYVAPFYLKFKDDYKHLYQNDFDANKQMFKVTVFPEYYVRVNFVLYVKQDETPKNVCLEFGSITKINDLDSIPQL